MGTESDPLVAASVARAVEFNNRVRAFYRVVGVLAIAFIVFVGVSTL